MASLLAVLELRIPWIPLVTSTGSSKEQYQSLTKTKLPDAHRNFFVQALSMSVLFDFCLSLSHTNRLHQRLAWQLTIQWNRLNLWKLWHEFGCRSVRKRRIRRHTVAVLGVECGRTADPFLILYFSSLSLTHVYAEPPY